MTTTPLALAALDERLRQASQARYDAENQGRTDLAELAAEQIDMLLEQRTLLTSEAA